MGKKKKRYTATQRKAYWIGYGMTLADGVEKGCDTAFWGFKDNSSNEELNSFQKGLLAPIHKPYIPKKSKKNKAR